MGTISTIILFAIIAYLFFFKREFIKNYWKEKNLEVAEKVRKNEEKKSQTK